MAKYRKYDTCFFERYAQLCLTELLGGDYAGLVNADRPDLQSQDDSHDVGIEVTRAMEQNKDAARHLLKEMAGVTATDEDLKTMAHKCAVGVGGSMGSARLLNEADMLAIYEASR